MPTPTLLTIIDGYNLLMGCGLVNPQQIGPRTLKLAREKLVRILKTRLKSAARQTAVVFDSNRLAAPSVGVDSVIQIFYSNQFPDADAMIIEMIRQHSAPRQLLIVSSDHQIQIAAQRRQAKFIDSDDWFFDHLGATQQEVQPESPSQVEMLKTNQKQLSDSDTLSWTDLFSKEHKKSDSTRAKRKTNESKSDSKKEKDEIFNPFPEDYVDDLFDE